MNSRENLPMMLSANDIQAMGFTRTMAYNILNREDVPVVKIGSREFIQGISKNLCTKVEKYAITQVCHLKNRQIPIESRIEGKKTIIICEHIIRRFSQMI